MVQYIINAFAIIITAWFGSKIPYCQNNRGECKIGELTITIGKTVYKVCGAFKPTGKTLNEKLLRNMEKELELDTILCYNISKSQKGLDCKQERSIV